MLFRSIDIIGNQKLDIINDAEIPSVIYSTFKELGFDSFTIKINNRKILNGFFQYLNIDDSTEVLRAIDKMDKIGLTGVIGELSEIGLDDDTIDKLMEFMKIQGTNAEILHTLKELNIDNEIFALGLEELNSVIKNVGYFGVPEENLKVDLTIARGLDYYTGTVYETFLDEYPSIGSICSGGRYEDLSGYYTKQKLPGVGISIGLTRLFYQLKEANIIKSNKNNLADVLIIPMKGFVEEGIKFGNDLRINNINTQIYLEGGKVGKKFNYADKLDIPYVLIIGSDEVENNKATLRDMKTGEQVMHTLDEVIEILKDKVN